MMAWMSITNLLETGLSSGIAVISIRSAFQFVQQTIRMYGN